MKINKSEHVRCPWCIKVSTLEAWENLTYSKCTNREMKRDYTHLYDSKAFSRNIEAYYMCPKCGKWSKGSQLKIVDTEYEALAKLGGESLFKTNKKQQ